MDTYTDNDILTLVQRAQRGDREAFGRLAVRFEQTVFAIVLRRLRNRSEAREVTQDVFVQMMRKISQLREPERFVGWLRQVATRMAINRAVRRPHEVSGGTAVATKPERETPLDTLMRAEDAVHVRGGLARLRDLDRQTLQAFYFDGCSLKEMSDQFDSPIGTIKRRLHTARNRLREELVGMQPRA